ncbi:MAG: oligopeptidase B [Candidatus Rifleibacteriota bacterium]
MKATFLLLMVSVLSAMVSASASAVDSSAIPPVARREVKIKEIHGKKLLDPYYWLRNKESKEVIRYLKEENRYTEEVMKDTKELQERLFEEMKSRIKETDLSVPERIDNYEYYSRTEEGKQYRIHCRRKIEPNAIEEIIFEENKYAQGKPYFALGALKISPDHNIIAYSVDYMGNEKFELHFLNLETGMELGEVIASVTYGIEWAQDNKTVFYTLMDETGRADRIMKHKIGTEQDRDILIYKENDGKFWTGIGKTRDRKFLLISSNSSTSSEVRFAPADKPDSEFKIFRKREKGIEYGIIHQGNDFYIYTNENAVNFKVMKTPDDKIEKENWQPFIDHRPHVLIDDINAFANYIVISERERGLQTLKYYDLKKKEFRTIPFSEAVYSVHLDSNPMYDTDVVRYRYTSLTTPESVYDFNLATGKAELKKRYEVLGSFNSSDYISERIFATANDGTAIPISLVHRKDQAKGVAPLYLTAYGAYGSSFDPYFSSIRLSLLDRGFTYAIAHVRGGQELGRLWYENGKLLKKKNTFTDFIACAEHLIDKGYTDKNHLVINGGSAGGLLIGAVVNMRPDLFKIAIADVPFVDVINTMSDPSLPLVREEYEEWGNPEDKEFFEYMLSYSPYDNIKPQRYPIMLVTAGLNDPRVSYWEPAKFVAKLRATKTDTNPLLLKTNMDAGHAGASGRYDFLKEIAFEYAFIFKFLNIKF